MLETLLETLPQSTALSESLDLLLPKLATLGSAEAKRQLQTLASQLSPILRGVFECRLVGNTAPIDLQQCLSREAPELITALQSYIAAVAAAPPKLTEQPLWQRLQAFLQVWPTQFPSINEVWLEYDVDTRSYGGPALPLPAIFIGLPHRVTPATITYPTAAAALNLLLGDQWRPWQAAVEQCFKACPPGAFISHIGLMLSRETPVLRVNVKRLKPQLLENYLQQVGWPEATDIVSELMQTLTNQVNGVVVCLDVGCQVYPKLGLECMVRSQDKHSQALSSWDTFLSYLVEQHLCDANKKEALLNWHEIVNPTNAQAPWPSHLIAESLLRPKSDFSQFNCKISHTKITWQPQQRLEAKAYLWFEHLWLSKERKLCS